MQQPVVDLQQLELQIGLLSKNYSQCLRRMNQECKNFMYIFTIVLQMIYNHPLPLKFFILLIIFCSSISTIENDGEPTKLQSNRQHNQKPYGRTIKTEKEVKFMADAMNSIKQTTTHIKSLITEKEKYSAEIDTNDPDTVFGMFLLAKLNEADKNTRKQIINHLHDWLKKHVSDSESSSDSEYSSEKESVSNL